MSTIEQTIKAILQLRAEVELVVAALDRHSRNEPDAAKAGALRRLYQVLQDFCHQSKAAFEAFAQTYKQSAAIGLVDLDHHLQGIMSSAAPDDPNRKALEAMRAKVRTIARIA